jgi:serine protease AprX
VAVRDANGLTAGALARATVPDRRTFILLLQYWGVRRILGIVVVLAAAAAAIVVLPAQSDAVPARLDPRVLAEAQQRGPDASLDVVLTLARAGDQSLQARLAGVATWAWVFPHLPAAGVRLPVAHLDALRRVEGVKAVYPNERLRYELADSAKLMNTERAWNDLGVTGKGVTIAILDSGVDGTHPDLAPALKQNVKLLELGAPTPVVPLEDVPDSDTSSGHGTHVAGDAAGRGTQSDGKYKGMGYGADLVGLGSGEVLSIFTALEGFDYIIANRDKYDIRVVNNSWNTDFEAFDPEHPINVATKAVHDAGVVVVFAAGNATDEMTMGAYAAAPWVIPVAAGSKTGGITDFSSGGLEADLVGTGFDGTDVHGEIRSPNNLGYYHPAVTSTGDRVVSTRANLTVVPLLGATDDAALGPDAIWYTTVSGTSMASPETAGVVAMLLEANPALTPEQVRSVLEVTARPIEGVPFYKQGYGYTDASAAVDLARALVGKSGSQVGTSLSTLHAKIDAALLQDQLAHPTNTRAWKDPAGLGPVHLEHKIDVPTGSVRVKAVANGPSTVEANLVEWDITLTDANGQAVAATSNLPVPNITSGTAVLDLDLTNPALLTTPPDQLAFGEWTLSIDSANSPAVSTTDDPLFDDLPRPSVYSLVAVFAAPPVSCLPVPVFEATGRQSLRLQDDDPTGVPFPGNPDYTYIGPVRDGSLGVRAPNFVAADFDVVTTGLPGPAPVFMTEPLAEPLTLGGPQTAEVWVQRAAQAASGIFGATLYDVAPDGSPKTIGATDGTVGVNEDVAPARTAQDIVVAKGYTVAAGHRLAMSVNITFIGTVGDTLLYDSDEFPSGVTLTVGRVVDKVLCNVATKVQGAVAAPAPASGAPAPAPAGASLAATGGSEPLAAALGLVLMALVARALRRRVAR